jgi:hypothetical protein
VSVRRTTLEFDVARDQWSAFLREFTLDHQSRRAVVEAYTPSSSPAALAPERRLKSVSVDDACGLARAIHILLAGEDGRGDRGVDVPDPIAIRLVEEPGRLPSLEIHQSDGRCTRLRFNT